MSTRTAQSTKTAQTRWVILASSRPEVDAAEVEQWLGAMNQLPNQSDRVLDADAGRVLAGSVADADVTADVRISADEAQPLAAIPALAGLLDSNCFSALEALALNVIASSRQDDMGPRVKRTLALTVRAGTPEREIERFERSLAAMPSHIREIRSWSLSRVDRARSGGPWTHVWEQEYADVDGVRVAYLQHPYHWTGVDRWFDPEMPCAIVEPRLAHIFRWADRPIVASGQ
jgi:hypothetical protein